MGWEQLLSTRCWHPKPFLAHLQDGCRASPWQGTHGPAGNTLPRLVPTAAKLVGRALLSRAGGKLKIIIKKKQVALSISRSPPDTVALRHCPRQLLQPCS